MAHPSIQKPPPVAMAHPNAYPISHRPFTGSTLDSLRYHVSSDRNSFFRLRILLGCLAIIVTAVMSISLIFVAHAYYHQWGGQGFLKARDVLQTPNNDLSFLFLPLRKIYTASDARDIEGESLLLGLPWNTRSLGPGSNVPFYTCGDQASSCEAYDQPNICCPVSFNCYKGTFTNSGIFCCNATRSEFDCVHAEKQTPKCMDSMVECSVATGGGCCPSAMECSPNGCIHVNPASTLSSANSSTSETFSPSSISASATVNAPSSATHNSVSITGTPITVTNYITVAPKATVTLAKTGETVGAGSGAGSLVTTMHLPYSFGCALLGVAFFMGTM